jgi:phosphocarrier protein
MMSEQNRISRTVIVTGELGLHARPAAKVVHIASGFQSELKLRRLDARSGEADCRSVLAMLMLAACKGTELELSACGDDASAALDAVESYFSRGFDEN